MKGPGLFFYVKTCSGIHAYDAQSKRLVKSLLYMGPPYLPFLVSDVKPRVTSMAIANVSLSLEVTRGLTSDTKKGK